MSPYSLLAPCVHVSASFCSLSKAPLPTTVQSVHAPFNVILLCVFRFSVLHYLSVLSHSCVCVPVMRQYSGQQCWTSFLSSLADADVCLALLHLVGADGVILEEARDRTNRVGLIDTSCCSAIILYFWITLRLWLGRKLLYWTIKSGSYCKCQ